MAPFIIIAALMTAAAAAGLFFITRLIYRSETMGKLAGRNKAAAVIMSLIPAAALLVYGIFDIVNAVVFGLNAVVIFIIFNLLWKLVRKLAKLDTRKNFGILAALLFTAVYMGTGWYLAHHVAETYYSLETAKELGQESLRVVQISDSHVGATFDGEGFAEHMKNVDALKPDIVVITGDYVDDVTTREDMIRCCEALGTINTKYGIYFIYGNHDKGYFGYRNFTYRELEDELLKNGVVILEDENVLVNDRIYLIGRQDRTVQDRASMKDLTKGLDMSKYVIVLDHQPHDFAAQAEAGVDLVLCGHTHGGQMFPVGLLGELTGANDRTYGLEMRGGTAFIVNSGISDWAIEYKTFTKAEIGVIDINEKR